ncbi:MAG TPA: hypothetical protein DIU01_14085, partial [Flavobacterium sp.]|nr:hypothetical protein [Flavobacterium sp.]
MMLAGALATQAQEAPTTGFLLPRMTTAQKTALVNPAKGLTIFNTTTNVQEINTGTAAAPVWSVVSAGSGVKWVDGATAGDIELVNPTGVDYVKHTNKGYLSYDKNDVAIKFNLGANGITTGGHSIFNYSKMEKSLFSNVVENNTSQDRFFTKGLINVIDAGYIKPTTKSSFGLYNLTTIPDNNTNSYGSVYSAMNFADGWGSGQVDILGGAFNIATSRINQNINHLIGTYNIASVSGDKNITRVASVFGEVNFRGTSTTNASGTIGISYNFFAPSNFELSSQNVVSHSSYLASNSFASTYSGTVTNIYDFRSLNYDLPTSGTITNLYGIAIEGNLKKNYISGKTSIGNRTAINRNAMLEVSGVSLFNFPETSLLARFWNDDVNGLRSLDISNYTSSDGVTGAGWNFNARSLAGKIKFQTNSLDRLIITEDGRLGIGTSNPSGILSVLSSTYINFDRANSTAPMNLLLRSSLGTTSSPSALTNNSEVGKLTFDGFDGTTWRLNGTANIIAQATENWTASSTGTKLKFATTPNGSTTITERLVIENNGNVGIGTTTPT